MVGKISRSEQKRRLKRIEEAAAELARISDRDLAALEVGEEIKAEILACRTVRGGAFRRQIKYLARVVREEDAVDQIFTFLAERRGSKVKANQLHHEAERLRDLMINEVLAVQELLVQQRLPLEMDWPAETVQQVVERYDVDELELRRCLHAWARTRAQRHCRELFRILKAALERDGRRQRLKEQELLNRCRC